MNKFYISVLLVLLSTASTRAQLNFTFSALKGDYIPITGGAAANLVPDAANSEDHDDGFANSLPIGFTFKYNGARYNTISAHTNGFASFQVLQTIKDHRRFDYSTPDLTEGPYSETNSRPVLAPLWDDHDLFSFKGIVYKTTGVAPNRVFTLQWNDVYWDVGATNLSITFQLKLFEEGNVIEFHYKQLPGALGPEVSASIGITGTEIVRGNFISLNNASSSPVASSTVDTYTINTKPATGQIYRFTPPVFISRANGNWNDPATWAGNIVPPSKGAGVIIRHRVVGNMNATCNELKVEPQGALTLNQGIKIVVL